MFESFLYQDYGYRSQQDYIVITMSVFFMIQAHIAIGIYSFTYRYEILGTCKHEPANKGKLLLYVFSVALLPILYSLLAVEQCFEQLKQFEMFRGFDEDSITINQFQDGVAHRKQVNAKKWQGEVLVKSLEGCLESYWQTFILAVLYCQPGFDGLLNKQIVGLDLILTNKRRAVMFIGSFLLSFVTYAWGIVKLINH